MEQMTPRDEFLRLDADISKQNAQKLEMLRTMFPISVTEHIRRAVAIYDFAMQNFTNGGEFHVQTQSGSEIIPLFYTFNTTEDKEPQSRLSVNINQEVADVLKRLGLNDKNDNTSVLDNVINFYNQVMSSTVKGRALIIFNADGSTDELVVSGAL